MGAHASRELAADAVPWALLGVGQDGALVAVNLAQVRFKGIPDGLRRSLVLQAHSFCSSPPSAWGKGRTALSKRSDGTILVGRRAFQMEKEVATSEETYDQALRGTYHFLSPALRRIAQFVAAKDGVTAEELIAYLTPSYPSRAHTVRAMHTALSRIREHPGVALTKSAGGYYRVGLAEDRGAPPQTV